MKKDSMSTLSRIREEESEERTEETDLRVKEEEAEVQLEDPTEATRRMSNQQRSPSRQPKANDLFVNLSLKMI